MVINKNYVEMHGQQNIKFLKYLFVVLRQKYITLIRGAQIFQKYRNKLKIMHQGGDIKNAPF